MRSSSLLASPVARLGAYGLILVAALGGGAAVGAAVGPDPAADDEAMTEHEGSYRLELASARLAAGEPSTLRLVIEDAAGEPVTDYDVEHDRELHLIVVSRDLRRYAHVHPDRDAAGTWTVAVPALPAGPFRVFADFVPAGGERTSVAADLGVAGPYEPEPVAAPSSAASVDGYDVTFDGALVAGTSSELAVTVTRDGEPVTDLDPYLGALGHLVAISEGDLTYLHVHPVDDAEGPGGPTVRFAVDVASAGTFGLFFDFAHEGEVRTASVVTTTAGAPPATDGAHRGDDHG